jgi:hypothetical protein
MFRNQRQYIGTTQILVSVKSVFADLPPGGYALEANKQWMDGQHRDSLNTLLPLIATNPEEQPETPMPRKK